ncbi:hypothetical protein NM688_g6878 [Phlebia brevispora]|uniref:Uncharacterized protein n=1 Tax=Phlebia brevispora TaxID=194682 RepID=A0ACC1SBK3_9APHY|nr:hypothetical protein NM688_g6878 [Phlebia brevispora]
MHEQTSNNAIIPVPRPLGYTDIPRAVQSTNDAFKTDPMTRYVIETPDKSDTTLHRVSHDANLFATYASLVHKGTAWTIEDGSSIVSYHPAKESQPDWSVDKLIRRILPYVFAYRKYLQSPEQRKRDQEVSDKVDKIIEEAIGERTDAMIYLNMAATAPARQGRGYGSTLARIVITKADEERCAVWLVSSNKLNEKFYNSLGFETKAETTIGDDNPTWSEPPLIVSIQLDTVAVPKPRLLRYTDIPTAVKSANDAFKTDPVHRYVVETPDSNDRTPHDITHDANMSVTFAEFVRKGTAWTIESGAAIRPRKGIPPRRIHGQAHPVAAPVRDGVQGRAAQSRTAQSMSTPTPDSQRCGDLLTVSPLVVLQRYKELEDKAGKTVEETIGARKDAILYLNILATAPKKQGLGYGSALVRVVTAKADEEKRASWLISSNIANTGFYQSLGFEIKGQIVLGDDNPTWREPAVVMLVMVREYGDNDARAPH